MTQAICPCGCRQEVTGQRKYSTNACKQRVYRRSRNTKLPPRNTPIGGPRAVTKMGNGYFSTRVTSVHYSKGSTQDIYQEKLERMSFLYKHQEWSVTMLHQVFPEFPWREIKQHVEGVRPSGD